MYIHLNQKLLKYLYIYLQQKPLHSHNDNHFNSIKHHILLAEIENLSQESSSNDK